MRFTHWLIKHGGKTHLKKPGDWRYLCGKPVHAGDQGVMLKIGVCGTCAKMSKAIKKRGY